MGNTAKEATRRIMRNLMSYEFMTKYSYRGKVRETRKLESELKSAPLYQEYKIIY